MSEPPKPADILAAASVDPEARAAARERIQKLEVPAPYPAVERPTLGIDILVVPDSHATPGVPNHRYEWLGRLANDQGVDVVVDIGDWFDMNSLNAYDKPGKSGCAVTCCGMSPASGLPCSFESRIARMNSPMSGAVENASPAG